mmetsp:Transcript_29927/g.33548  ORF Transcript_29927/g.33548 Transcript_29927/m.33548 type:complete len:82 (-) Transcript_29927:269-514(-)
METMNPIFDTTTKFALSLTTTTTTTTKQEDSNKYYGYGCHSYNMMISPILFYTQSSTRFCHDGTFDVKYDVVFKEQCCHPQ